MDRKNHSNYAYGYPPLNQYYSSPSPEDATCSNPYVQNASPPQHSQPGPDPYLYMSDSPIPDQLGDSCQLICPHSFHEEPGQYRTSLLDSSPPFRNSSYETSHHLLLSSNAGNEDSNQTPQGSEDPILDNYTNDLSSFDNSRSTAASPPASLGAAPTKPLVPLGELMNRTSSSHTKEKKHHGHHRGFSAATGWDRISHEVLRNLRPPGSLHHSHRGLQHCSHHRHTQSLQVASHSKQYHGRGMELVTYAGLGGPVKAVLLHGNLDIWIYDAKRLPNMDKFHKIVGDVFGKFSGSGSSKIEEKMIHNPKITSDPYVSISIAGAVIGRTYVLSNEENPVWMQHFNVPVAHSAAGLNFIVKDSDVVGSQLIGAVIIPVEQISSGMLVKGTYSILNTSGKPCKAGAVLSLSVQYMPMDKLNIYHHGVGAGPDYQGVPGTYFPLRKGGSVTLYQDAHVPDGHLPTPKLDSGVPYAHGKCWQDIYCAIQDSRRLIYITGWSVWDRVRLLRDGSSASDYTLGELLRSKSRDGVRVLLLIWDDPTSRSILGYKTDGLMQTHDEETRRFFKHSSVQVLLCPRIAGKRLSWVKKKEVETIYTHHQKTVIVDADAGNNMRKIIAFLGGLDLCDGRYDTPQHPLFKTLDTAHKDDYHNPSIAGSTNGCPREPWHDLHCKIDGPAAYDVLTNFQDRWLKAAKPRGIKKLKKLYDDALLRIERIGDILGISDAPYCTEDTPDSWHAQIFRSIDSNSVKNFPKNPKEATRKNLVCGKNVLIDMSIHSAYVKAIRSAQHYIYIENQYFIGSSFNWSQHKDIGANNLIPTEIALKIADKIRDHERFAAYIVIPMWPEGIPTGAATQRILYWQNKTMQMMYQTIYKALVEVGLEDSYTPQDFLNFFCLGNREGVDRGRNLKSESTHAPNPPQVMCEKSGRFMIYVHSKGMIVDDEYVILGSANINQRSMEGTRDTEIAMGGYQPHYTWANQLAHPRGQIYGYRMSLWAEHLGGLEDLYDEPESLECVRRVRTQAELNWQQFASEQVTEMKGHLLKYPVAVDRRGRVRPLKGCEQFPDVGGNICGSFLAIQENLTI